MRKTKEKKGEISETLKPAKTVRVNKNAHSLLKVLAAKRGVKLEDLVNEAIAIYLETESESVKP